jgi:hypothetical protein
VLPRAREELRPVQQAGRAYDDSEGHCRHKDAAKTSDIDRYGRVMIRALNNAGKAQDTDAGIDLPKDNGHWYYEDKLSVTSADSVRLQVAMQSQLGTDSNGDPTYQDAGVETVSVAE